MQNEKKEAAHTPTPWAITTNADNVGVDICMTNKKGEAAPPFNVAKQVFTEDAAFIVKAVNAYDKDQAKIAALREAIEGFIEAREAAQRHSETGKLDGWSIFMQVKYNDMRAALAQAKED